MTCGRHGGGWSGPRTRTAADRAEPARRRPATARRAHGPAHLLEDAAEDPAEVRQLTGELRDGLHAALDDLRALARGIYPPLLADQGLARPSGHRRQGPASGSGRGGRDRPLPAGGGGHRRTSASWRRCRTSRSTPGPSAKVTLACPDGHLEFTVTDDGDGFDTAKPTPGTGLQGMADRLAAAGGTLCIRSAPGLGLGLGTTISGRMPAGEPASGPPGAGQVTPRDSPDQHGLLVTPVLAALTAALPRAGAARQARAPCPRSSDSGPCSRPDGCSPISFRPHFALRASTRSAG